MLCTLQQRKALVNRERQVWEKNFYRGGKGNKGKLISKFNGIWEKTLQSGRKKAPWLEKKRGPYRKRDRRPRQGGMGLNAQAGKALAEKRPYNFFDWGEEGAGLWHASLTFVPA